ncbi:MAG: hypothetical protein ACI9XU_000953 [Arenicella sp.]|jgi:hypothetical protein
MDPLGTTLQRVQMFKAWIKDGQSCEQVVDVACSDGMNPNPETAQCGDNGAKLDIKTCLISNESGDSEMKVIWKNPDLDPDLSSFHYVRVLENQSCRWRTYDAICLGIEPLDEVPSTIAERAWSSPIW